MLNNDLSPISTLTNLGRLYIGHAASQITDLTPLSGMTELEFLTLNRGNVADLSVLSKMARLRHLSLNNNRTSDLRPLSALSDLSSLSLTGNVVEDLSPLSDLSNLGSLYVSDNVIADISYLAGLDQLRTLHLGRNPLSLAHILEKEPLLPRVTDWGLNGLGISDLNLLSNFTGLTHARLRDNGIRDIGPLLNIDGLQLVDLGGNPLSQVSLKTYATMLEARGVRVIDAGTCGGFRDESLCRFMAQRPVRIAIAERKWLLLYLAPLTVGPIVDLTGIERAKSLEVLMAGGNDIVDVSPLLGLAKLRTVDLHDNDVTDITPLVRNPGLGAGDWINLRGNPLSRTSITRHIPPLLKRGVQVDFDLVTHSVEADGGLLMFDRSDVFSSMLGGTLIYSATSSDPRLATVVVEGGVITVLPNDNGLEGVVLITVTATDRDGHSISVHFDLKIQPSQAPPLLRRPWFRAWLGER